VGNLIGKGVAMGKKKKCDFFWKSVSRPGKIGTKKMRPSFLNRSDFWGG